MSTTHGGQPILIHDTDTPYVCLQELAPRHDIFHLEGRTRGVDLGEFIIRVSSMLFRFLEHEGVSSHYLDTVDAHQMRVRWTDPFALNVMVRSVVAGDLAARLGLARGTTLERPILEWTYDMESLGYPLLNDDHVLHVLKLATSTDLTEIRRQAALAYEAAHRFWREAGYLLVDATMLFGRTVDKQIVLSGLLSPENMRLWEVQEDGTHPTDAENLSSFYEQMHARLVRTWPQFNIGDRLS